jgi:hypothetical protein
MSLSPILEEIYETGEIELGDGSRVPVHSQVTRPNIEGLRRAVLQERPESVLEIGMAHGISSLAILGALEEIGGDGQLLSIDPHQTQAWGNGGRRSIERSGLAARHALIEDFDFLALPELVRQKRSFDFAYVDGYHSFDYVMLDFFFVDRMLEVGGVVGFNDCGWPSIFRVLRFIQSHKKYAEVDVGIPPDYHGRSPVRTLARRLRGFNWSDRYFRKLEQHTPANNFYARF